MADRFQFASAFVCERVLQEQDGVISAIRIADIFSVAENTPEGAVLQFWAVATFKTTLPSLEEREYTINTFVLKSSGERERLDPSDRKVRVVPYEGDLSIPVGISVVAQVNVKLKPTGTTSTSIIEIEIDGDVEARIPFTIRRIPTS